MKRLFRLPLGVRLSISAVRERGDLCETSAGVVVSAPLFFPGEAIGVGWGWDDDCPVALRLRVAREENVLDGWNRTDGIHVSFAGFYALRRWLVSPGGSR